MFGQVFYHLFNCADLKSAKASDSVCAVCSMYTQIMLRVGLLHFASTLDGGITWLYRTRVCKAFGNTEVVVGLTGRQAITAL